MQTYTNLPKLIRINENDSQKINTTGLKNGTLVVMTDDQNQER